jgi:WD40 repeat protein
VGDGAGRVRLLDATTGEPAGPDLSHPAAVWSVAFAADGRTVYTGCRDGVLRTWQGQGVVQAWERALPVRALAVDPGGAWLLAGRGDRRRGELVLHDLRNGAERVLVHGQGPVYAVAASPDGRHFAASTGPGKVWVHDAASLQEVGPALDHPARVVALAFSPDGKALATGCTDQRVRLWGVADRVPVGEPMAHRGAVWSVAFHPAGRYLAAGGRDTGVALWDVRTQHRVGPALAHDGVAWALAFTGGGTSLWTGCGDRHARLWTLPPLELPGDAGRLRLWCQVITGMELSERGGVEVLSVPVWRARRDQLRGEVASR